MLHLVGISLCSWLDSARMCFVGLLAAEVHKKQNFYDPVKNMLSCLPRKRQVTSHWQNAPWIVLWKVRIFHRCKCYIKTGRVRSPGQNSQLIPIRRIVEIRESVQFIAEIRMPTIRTLFENTLETNIEKSGDKKEISRGRFLVIRNSLFCFLILRNLQMNPKENVKRTTTLQLFLKASFSSVRWNKSIEINKYYLQDITPNITKLQLLSNCPFSFVDASHKL